MIGNYSIPHENVMTVYIIAQLKFTRRELYNRYQSRFADVFRKFKGKLLVADEHPVIMEGKWERDKVVIMEFPDDAAAQEFQTSPEIRRSRSIARRARTPSCSRCGVFARPLFSSNCGEVQHSS